MSSYAEASGLQACRGTRKPSKPPSLPKNGHTPRPLASRHVELPGIPLHGQPPHDEKPQSSPQNGTRPAPTRQKPAEQPAEQHTASPHTTKNRKATRTPPCAALAALKKKSAMDLPFRRKTSESLHSLRDSRLRFAIPAFASRFPPVNKDITMANTHG